jgi:hypothetical protein
VCCGNKHDILPCSICLDAGIIDITIVCQLNAAVILLWASILYLSTNQSGLFLFQRHMQDKIKRDSIYVWQCL